MVDLCSNLALAWSTSLLVAEVVEGVISEVAVALAASSVMQEDLYYQKAPGVML
jgi:hypothetical protein